MKRYKYLYLLVPALIGFLLYLSGLSGPFLLDDFSNQINSYSYKFDLEYILSASFSNQSGMLRRPLAQFTFVLNAIIDKSPWSYKFVNVLLHLITGALLFILLKRIIRIKYPRDISRNHLYLVASIALSAWLLHPLQVSTVLYAVQRMTIMSGLFVIAALLSYTAFRERILHARPPRTPLYIAGYSVFGVLGLACKENTALLPVFALIIEFTIFQFRLPQIPDARRSFYLFFVLLVGTPLLLGAFYSVMHVEGWLAGYDSRYFSLTERVLTEVHALVFYLRMFFIPDLSMMGIFHDDFPLQQGLDLITLVYLFLFLCAISAACIYRKRFPIASLGILWFFSAHLLESTILPLELVYEHRNYLALAMLSFLFADIAVHVLRRESKALWRTAVLSGLTLFLALSVFLTALRVDTWSSKEKLLSALERYHPDSVALLMEQVNLDAVNKRYDLALEKTERIGKLRPREAKATIIRLLIDCYAGVRSENDYQQALEFLQNPNNVLGDDSGLTILGKLAINKRCGSYSTEEIMTLLQAALADKSIRKAGRTALTLHMTTGKLFFGSGNTAMAIAHYEKAYQSNPSDLGPLLEKAYLELNSNMLEEAEQTVLLLRAKDKSTIRYYAHLIDELEQYLSEAKRDNARLPERK